MIEVEAPDVCRHWHQRGIYLFIPGGWTMRVPVYRIEGEFEDAYIDWYRRLGLSFEKAQAKMKQGIQDTCGAGFRTSLLHSIVHYAKAYADMYPERMKPVAGRPKTFTLVGYDPEAMQAVHVPGYNPSKGQPLAKKLLLEMGTP